MKDCQLGGKKTPEEISSLLKSDTEEQILSLDFVMAGISVGKCGNRNI